MGKKARLKALRKTLEYKEQTIPSNIKSISSKIPLGSFDKLFTISGLVLVASAIIYLAFTILKPGLPAGHDIAAHTIYSRLFIDALREGQFPVRWIQWTKDGFDFPLFNFYQVGFYYLAAITHLFIPFLTSSLKITILLLWWLGSLFMFLYAKRFGNLPAALSALIYAFTPYLLLDIFVRTSYPEITAITFAVGTLWGLDRLLTTSKPIYGLPLSIFGALLIISHLPSSVIIAPLLSGYVLLLIFTQEARAKGFHLVAVSTLISFGLAAFYLIPALYELNLVKSQLLISEYYDFHPHFVYPEQLFSNLWEYGGSFAGANDEMSFQIGIIQWFIIFSTLFVLIIRKISDRISHLKFHLVFWGLVILYAIFFMHDISLSFWENIKMISFIQYPWRFLMILIFAPPIMGAILLNIFSKRWFQLSVIFIITIAVFVLYSPYLKPSIFLPDDYFNIDSKDWKKSEGVIKHNYLEEGYLPKEVEQLPTKPVNRWEIVKGKGKVEEKVIKNHQLIFTIQAEESLVFQINSHYFPGWKVFVDNVQIQEDHNNPYDFMNITIPAGIHTVEAKFTNTPLRSASNTITILSFLILLVWQAYSLATPRLKRV